MVGVGAAGVSAGAGVVSAFGASASAAFAESKYEGSTFINGYVGFEE